MSRLLSALDRHWFAPASLRDLALVRMLAFGAQTFVFLAFPVGRLRPFSAHVHQATVGAELYEPVAVLRLLLLPFVGWDGGPPGATLLAVAYAVAFVAGVLATVGLFARPAMLVAAAANALVVAHYHSYGEYHHHEALMMIALGVLALAPCARVWSLDARRRRRRADGVRADDVGADDVSPFARWPLRLIQWVMALTYLSAALSKLKVGGLTWFNGYTMTYHFANAGLRRGADLAVWVATLPPELHIVPAAAAFLFELLFFVAILRPRTAWLVLLVGVVFHLSVYATMRISFFQTILLYCVFVEALRLHAPRWLRASFARTPFGRTSTAPPASPPVGQTSRA